MATNLQVDNAIGAVVQRVNDEAGQSSALAVSSTVVGINTAAVGKALEIVGDVGGDGFCVRDSANIPASALGFSAHENGLGSLWTNSNYDPATPTKNWKRTINLRDGNVGLGRDVQAPDERLAVDGDIRVNRNIVVGGLVGGTAGAGQLVLHDETGERIVALQAGTGDLKIGGHGKDGDITLFPASATDIGTPAQASIHLDGQTGDIRLLNADAAEEFEASSEDPLGPGDVMVLGHDGRLRLCDTPYDRRVAGVVSGAGGHRPGIILGHDESRPGRVELALIGRVYCKVVADDGAIAVGDLLTTSSVPGHAMRVREQERAFGAVIGKAMGRLERGTGLVETLVALQ